MGKLEVCPLKFSVFSSDAEKTLKTMTASCRDQCLYFPEGSADNAQCLTICIKNPDLKNNPVSIVNGVPVRRTRRTVKTANICVIRSCQRHKWQGLFEKCVKTCQYLYE